MKECLCCLVSIALPMILAGCQEKFGPKYSDVKVIVEISPTMEYVPDFKNYEIAYATLAIRDINLNISYLDTLSDILFPLDFNKTLRWGYYDFDFRAKLIDTLGKEININGFKKGVVINADAPSSQDIEIEVIFSDPAKSFVISEIFFSGTINPISGKQYTGDKYFVFTNNSDSVLYADGLLLLESCLLNSKQYSLSPDFRNSLFAAGAIYRIPGSGTDYPVQPGKSILIADNAMNHTHYNANSFDLSMADFEWFDISTSATIVDIDNPAVPNLHKLYCYTQTIWMPSNQGNRSYAIARIPTHINDQTFLKDYAFSFDYITYTSAGSFPMTQDKSYKIPNEWIVDAVNLCPRTQYQWIVTSESFDAGFTYVAETGDDKTRYGKCVRRKSAFSDTMERWIYTDDNNSTTDFLVSQPADPTYLINR